MTGVSLQKILKIRSNCHLLPCKYNW